eukprot:2162782-Prymnesium_polylepis.1
MHFFFFFFRVVGWWASVVCEASTRRHAPSLIWLGTSIFVERAPQGARSDRYRLRAQYTSTGLARMASCVTS